MTLKGWGWGGYPLKVGTRLSTVMQKLKNDNFDMKINVICLCNLIYIISSSLIDSNT